MLFFCHSSFDGDQDEIVQGNEMNWDKLKMVERNFLDRYPDGFMDPEMVAVSQKHKPEKMTAMAREFFCEDGFSSTEKLMEHLIKMVSASSMVSVFEKPRFRDFVRSLNSREKECMSDALYEFLYGEEEKGFNGYRDVLAMGKLAKWTLMTVVPAYLRPQTEVFIKPMTTKGILKTFAIAEMVYQPRPYYEFYTAYRQLINEMKTKVSPSLSPTNAAFSGFLMMSIGE